MTISKAGRCLLAVSPLAVIPAAFFSVAPWLKTHYGAALTLLVGGACALTVMTYALQLSIRWQRRLDEVQVAGGNFAARWGMTAGTMTFALLTMLPPFWDFLAAVIRDGAGDPGASRKVVVFAVMFGFGSVVILQTIGMFVLSVLWWKARR